MDFKSLPQLLDFFKDEKTCIEYYENIRWAGNPVCPHCGTANPYKTNRGYKCGNNECYKKFTVKVGTIFENSKIPFRIWFAAIYLCTVHKKGISSVQLSIDLDITQKTGWFVLHRVREMLKQDAPQMLGGEGKTLESDSTYLGGKEKNKHASKKKYTEDGKLIENKKVILGLIERNGKVILKHIPSESTAHMTQFVQKYAPKGSTIFTDEHKGYKGLGKIYTHDTVNHSLKVYCVGNVHTNTIENFWSVLKRGIYGIYHQVSEKHLNRYLNEYASRFNARLELPQERIENFLLKSEQRLTYKNLIS